MEKELTIQQYIEGFGEEIQEKLIQIHQTIIAEVPELQETIKYKMPTYTLNGKNMVHFAAYSNHIGFYPTPSAIVQFQEELKTFKTSKGAIQFPIDKPLPLELICRIVAFRKHENSLINNEKSCK